VKILVVGSGGREHAFIDKFRRDAPDATLFAAPGNPGMALQATLVPIPATDIDGLATFATSEEIELTVVGPEVPLARGIVDLFESRGLTIFGPSAAAARLESSKAFAKRLMADHDVPTAGFACFTEPAEARDYVAGHPEPLVIKASGLAAGKGAIVCPTRPEAVTAIDQVMVDARFGDAGSEIVVEEFMEGIELSVFFLADGKHAEPLLTSRDYKRIGEGDTGPNTGGMGAYAPAAPCGHEFIDTVRRRIADPVLGAMRDAGTPFRGFLYVGLMLTSDGPKVVEFNCRLGDPETQAVLPLTRSNLLDPMLAIARGGRLDGWAAEATTRSTLVTVIASAGYPVSSDPGRAIELPEIDAATERVYHAGTALERGRLVTAGGRVLAATATGETLEEAALASRALASRVRFEGSQWRPDIGWHELTPDRVPAPLDELLRSG